MSGNWDTPPATYGPFGPPQYSNKYDPYAKRSSQISPTATIKDIYPRVMNEKPEDIAQAAQGWIEFAKQIDTIRQQLHDNFGKVQPTWDSDAGIVFTGYVVGTTSTLADWHDAAKSNGETLQTLATTVKAKQKRMQEIWNSFDQAAADAKKEENEHWYSSLRKLGDDLSGHNPFDDVMEKYTNQAKSEVLEPLNTAFSDAFIGVRPGMKWNGPNNGPSEGDVKNAMTKLNAPPGGPAGGMPTMPGGATPPTPPPTPTPPAVPPPPATPPPGTPPPLPPTVPPPGLPPTTTAPPPLPTAPPAPTLPVAPVALTAPTMPTAPDAPTAPTAPDAPIAPTAIPPVAPNALRSPGGPPGAPEAPDTMSPPALRRGAPPSGLGEPESGMGGPMRPPAPGMPRGLSGRGGGPPGESEIPPGMRSGMRPPPPMLRGRGGGPSRKPGRPGGPAGDEPELPPGRGTPALPGRNGKQTGRGGRPGGPGGPGSNGEDIPPNRLGSRRNLQGIRDPKPRWRPGSLEAEEIPLRRLPTLTGRFAPETVAEESLESAERALRPGLGGRGLSRPDKPAAKRQSEPRRDGKREAPAVDFVGDSELFTPDHAAPAVIDRPEQAPAVTPEKSALRPQT